MSSILSAAYRRGLALPVFILLLSPAAAQAHAISGDRVFPATLAVEDPGVADEITLPQVTVARDRADGWTTETEVEFSKRLTETFALSAGGAWVNTAATEGWDDFSLGAKYVFFNNAPHEFMAAAAIDWDIGGTGAERAGVETASTYTPALLLGKGMGDLPVKWLKPFAVTGTMGVAFPSDTHEADGTVNPRKLIWGGTVQYSLPYLQQHVKDIGLGKPFSQMIPVVELAMDSPLDGDTRVATGTVNPGVLFQGQDMQLGLEAVIPANRASGATVGVTAQLHVFLDDLFPRTLGRPLW
jgi:hypothetical protein